MANNGTRPYDTNTSSQEQDANSALIELDKGLRSQKIGDQCEAVVRFPRLFEKYPFPILVNSALLKLAEVFRAGSNFIRLCILRVTQQAEKHLDKVLNVDDFIRRIFSVIHSNDPIARAITLRTLGSVASIITEKTTVHHSIVVSLDSHDAIEVDAAVYAAQRFAARSKLFSASICDRIAQMIEKVETPMELKLQLIPILQHMHHDAETAAKARTVCLLLLKSYPAKRFVMLTLHTMSKLAIHALLDITQQISLLLNYLENDPRKTVKIMVLKDLQMLACKTPHLWVAENVEVLCRFVLTTPFVSLKEGVLYVLTELSSSISMDLLPFTLKDSALLKVCQEYSYHENVSLAAKTVQLMTHLATHSGSKEQNNMDLRDDVKAAAQTLILLSSMNSSQQSQVALKLSLKCVVKMCSKFPELCIDFVDTMANLLQSNPAHSLSDVHMALVCDSLAAVGSTNSAALEPILPILMDILSAEQGNFIDPSVKARLCTLLFLMAHGENLPENLHNLVMQAAPQGDAWQAYRVVRQAMRYQQYHIAVNLLCSIKNKVASEHFYFWLSGLHDLCLGDSLLTGALNKPHQCDTGTTNISSQSTKNNLSSMIGEALTHYQRGISQLQAATTQNFRLQFQSEYCSLRCELVQLHQHLCQTCSTFQTCPPPAIASAMAVTNSRDISRCGPVISQLLKCQNSYSNLSQKFLDLYQSSFDADPASLANMQLLYTSSELMKAVINTILTGQTRETLTLDKASSFYVKSPHLCPVSRCFAKVLQTIAQNLNQLVSSNNNNKLTHQHIAFLYNSIKQLIQTSIGYPRYFFQTLQTTQVKLAISPQPHNSTDPVLLQQDTQLTLKVEGVVQHGNQPDFYRQVHAVMVNVTSVLRSHSHGSAATLAASGKKIQDVPPVKLSKTLEPQNDYFSSSFLIALPLPGFYNLTIKALLIDTDGLIWKTGPRITMSVKCFDDIMQRQQVMRSMSWTTS
ncbi:integrator complex subunit 7-like [Octopus vulgaris]|uniref:Integrator complex subunit 7 n=1 Tax=Octopus vulgaris TaxID=6645 RepID=A0AA36F2U5_OCTVU|nr:integrator complex subunit 7-like [Octopus vulgaris]